MSGGVDSSVAAFLLKKEGYDVTGVTMCFGRNEDGKARCCGPAAVEDARKVCEHLGIPHYVFDYGEEIEKKVISRFLHAYMNGKTPNPCIDCNRYLKFDSLLKKAMALGFDYLATGHYAKISCDGGKYSLQRPADGRKDQTYFLYPINPQALSKILFPLATLRKEEVRRLAAIGGLPVATKEESQDLCFVAKRDYPTFIARQIGKPSPGPIENKKGERLGTHRGLPFYTIGQRSGLGIAHPTPLYVIAIDPKNNLITVGERKDLRAKGLIAGDLNYLTPNWPQEVYAKVRYRREAARCRIEPLGEKLKVLFFEEEEAITPGQAVVFYHGTYVLGGGTIEEVIP